MPVAKVGTSDSSRPSGFVVGNVVAFTDDEDAKFYHLGDVLELRGDGSAKVHYRGARSAKVKNARFIPVHVESPTGLSILTFKMTKRLLSAGCTSAPWTGVIDEEDVLCFDVKLTAASRLAASMRRGPLSGFKHKIMV